MMGGDFAHRWTQTRDAILAMKALWTQEEAEYHGPYYDFPAVRSVPKPAQTPHPPVLLGGKAKNVFKRVAEWGDGWMPNRTSPDEIRRGRNTLSELAEAAGRDPNSVQIVAFGHAGSVKSRETVSSTPAPTASPCGWNRRTARAPCPKWTRWRGGFWRDTRT